MVFVDSRGTGRSPGNADVWSTAEARDYYDAIEWAAVQPWSTGKVGLAGVSYYAVTQWNVASLKPPHLAAFIPWEGFTDQYRDWAYPGGLFAQARVTRWWSDVTGKQLLEHTRIDNAAAYNENYLYNLMVNQKAGGVGQVANTQRFFEKSRDLQGFVAALEHNRRTGLIVSDGSPHMNSLAPVLKDISLQDRVHRRDGERC